MSLTVRYFPDVALWARGSGLEIVLLVTGTILLTRAGDLVRREDHPPD